MVARLVEPDECRRSRRSPHLRAFLSWSPEGSGLALLPRIFVLGELEPACQLMEESVGFRYSMEHWLHRMLTSNEAIVVNKAEVADFVYLPHCATSVFMHMVVQDEQEHQGVFRTANSQSELRLNSSILRRKEVFLGYEGNLPASSVLRPGTGLRCVTGERGVTGASTGVGEQNS
eukprot:g33156.t1